MEGYSTTDSTADNYLSLIHIFFTGKVVGIKEFGAFIEFAPGKEGMVHISKIAKERIEHVEDVLTLSLIHI